VRGGDPVTLRQSLSRFLLGHTFAESRLPASSVLADSMIVARCEFWEARVLVGVPRKRASSSFGHSFGPPLPHAEY
jgi:hypothetical protein